MTPQEFKTRRERLRLSQTALGELMGVTKQTIINYERPDGDGPVPMAALAISALDPGGHDSSDFENALGLFETAVLLMRDPDVAVTMLDNVELMAARYSAAPGSMGEVQRQARVIAFERLIAAMNEGKAAAMLMSTNPNAKRREREAIRGIGVFSTNTPLQQVRALENKRGIGSFTADPPVTFDHNSIFPPNRPIKSK